MINRSGRPINGIHETLCHCDTFDWPSTSVYHSDWPSNPLDWSIVALSKDSKIKTEVKLHDVIHIDDDDKHKNEIAWYHRSLAITKHGSMVWFVYNATFRESYAIVINKPNHTPMFVTASEVTDDIMQFPFCFYLRHQYEWHHAISLLFLSWSPLIRQRYINQEDSKANRCDNQKWKGHQD